MTLEEIDALRIVNFPIERNPIHIAESVLRDEDRFLVALLQEPWPPVQSLRCDRPAIRREWVAHWWRHHLFAGANGVAPVNVDAKKVERLPDRLHVAGFNARHVAAENLQTFLGVMPEEYRIAPPRVQPE